MIDCDLLIPELRDLDLDLNASSRIRRFVWIDEILYHVEERLVDQRLKLAVVVLENILNLCIYRKELHIRLSPGSTGSGRSTTSASMTSPVF